MSASSSNSDQSSISLLKACYLVTKAPKKTDYRVVLFIIKAISGKARSKDVDKIVRKASLTDPDQSAARSLSYSNLGQQIMNVIHSKDQKELEASVSAIWENRQLVQQEIIKVLHNAESDLYSTARDGIKTRSASSMDGTHANLRYQEAVSRLDMLWKAAVASDVAKDVKHIAKVGFLAGKEKLSTKWNQYYQTDYIQHPSNVHEPKSPIDSKKSEVLFDYDWYSNASSEPSDINSTPNQEILASNENTSAGNLKSTVRYTKNGIQAGTYTDDIKIGSK